MTVDEIKQSLTKYEFKYSADDEYHWDVYTNKGYALNIEDKKYTIYLEVSINYYNVRFIWYYHGNNKCTKIYYIDKDIPVFPSFEEMVKTFISYCVDFYRVKIENYEIEKDRSLEPAALLKNINNDNKNREQILPIVHLNWDILEKERILLKQKRLWRKKQKQYNKKRGLGQSNLSYYKQLKEPCWFAFREYVLSVKGHKCEICGSEKTLQIHHPVYRPGRKAWEYTYNEVVVLC